MPKFDFKRELINYLLILPGSILLALAMVGFLAPNQIATGGTAGLAIILHYVSEWPIGLLMALINAPLLLAGWKYLGRRFAFRSMACIGLASVFIEVLEQAMHFPALSNQPLLATLYGGVCAGIGLGLVFKGGGSAGGGTILARIITSRTQIKTGHVILILDAIVVGAAGLVFKSVELALWSMISIYATARMVDAVLTGRQSQKIVHISSFLNLEELSHQITERLGVSGTIVSGKDLHHDENKDIIFILVENNRINALMDLVYRYDPRARMIVMEATEMLGENRRK